MRAWSPLIAVLLALLGGCGAADSGEPAAVPFTRVPLPAGSVPMVLTVASHDDVLVGVRRDGQEVVPGLLRIGAGGETAEIPVQGVTGYGLTADWYSITSDGDRILAIGGKRGGAHGNVRWSVWTGDATGIAEKSQAFSTFGGYGAGDLIDAVLTPSAPLLVGTWESQQAGLDAAVWTAAGDEWTRQPSAGTPLESARESLKFPMAATTLDEGVLIPGWQLADGGRQLPMVWQSSSGNSGWTMVPLPAAGRAGMAIAARCWATTCAVTGRVDGELAIWHHADDRWTRLQGAPPISIGDTDKLPAPFEVDGAIFQLASEGNEVRVAKHDSTQWTVRAATGPTGKVTAATVAGEHLYLLANDELWHTDLTALR